MKQLLLCLWLIGFSPVVLAEGNTSYEEDIRLIEIDDADCAVNDGKMVAIQNLNQKETLVVWIDRWFMDKQTPDHTKQVLPPNKMPTLLGCSMTRAGKQHWTIYSIQPQP